MNTGQFRQTGGFGHEDHRFLPAGIERGISLVQRLIDGEQADPLKADRLMVLNDTLVDPLQKGGSGTLVRGPEGLDLDPAARVAAVA